MAAGAAYHRSTKPNRAAFRLLREVYRRSGGTTREVREDDLVDWFRERLQKVASYSEFLETKLRLDPDRFVPAEERARWEALPDTITLEGDEHPLDYGFDGETPVVRARIPAKLLPQLEEEQLPTLDRPLHWTVLRGKRGAIRAATLAEARERVAESRPEQRARSERGG